MKLYTIKLEDKAAILNRLKAAKINVPSYKIHNDSIDKTFNITIEDPGIQITFEKLLSSSPRIDVISKKDLKEILRKMVRRELREWKIERKNLPGDAPKEAEKIVKDIKELLINQPQTLDFDYKITDWNEVKIEILPYNTPIDINGYIELIVELEIDDGSVVNLEPYRILIHYDPPPGSSEDVYKSKDTTGIINILNDKKHYKELIRNIDEARYDFIKDPRNFDFD